MKNLLLKVSLKYGLILAGIYLIIRILYPYISLRLNLTHFVIIESILDYILWITFVVLAYKEFIKKNLNYISFTKAILIGLIVIGIPFIVLIIYNIIYFEFFKQEITQSYYRKYISSNASGLLIQIVVLFIIVYIISPPEKSAGASNIGYNERRCSVCNIVVVSKAMAVQTGNFNQSDRTCYNCGTILCFGCAANEGFMRSGLKNTLNCPKCGTNLNA